MASLNVQTSMMNTRITSAIFATVILTGFGVSTYAQDVSIPDPGLNAAVRETLQKPVGPLTEQDLLSLRTLNARRRSVRRIDGLEAARNLVSLELPINLLTNFALPGTLTKLTNLDLSINSLTNCFIPNGMTNLASLVLEANALRNLTLPGDLRGLKHLALEHNQLGSFKR